MASCNDSPLHAVEMTGAPDSSKGLKGEILEATEYEWRLRTKQMKEKFKKWIPKKIFRHDSSINCCAVTPDGKYLVTGGNDGKAILWNLKTRERVKVFEGDTNSVNSICVSGDHLVTGSGDDA